MLNDITVLIKGNELKRFKSFSLSDSLDALAAGFSFTIFRDQFDSKINISDEVKIFINTELYLTGRINKIERSYSVSNNDLTISGFAKTYDLLKATIYSNPVYSTPITFLSLAQKVMLDNGITDIAVAGGFAAGTTINSIVDNDEEGTAGNIGETVFAFLERYARKSGVLLSSDEFGRLVIYKNEPIRSTVRIRNNRGTLANNLIKSANYTVDFSNRFKNIIVRSQDEFGDTFEATAQDKAVNIDGTKVIISDNIADIAGCKIQADWEVNKRRADSIAYNATVVGFSYNPPSRQNQFIWKKNYTVDIEDNIAGVSSEMLIRSVQFSFDERSGSQTALEFSIPDSFDDKIKTEKRYEAIFGDSETERRYEQIFGSD